MTTRAKRNSAEQASTLLIDTDWRRLRSFERESHDGTLTVDIWSKNGKWIIIETFPDGGFELLYPSTQRTIANTIAEANAYALGATVTV